MGKLILMFWAFFLQSEAPPLAFEVASVKPASAPIATKDVYTEGYNAGMRAALAAQGVRVVGLRVTATDLTLRELIRAAFEVKEHQISGPSWMADEKYEIAAVMPAGSTREQVPAMLRTLLAERFHLKVHREKRKMAVYALVPVKSGAKLKAAAGGRAWSAWAGPNSGRLHILNSPVAALAEQLSKISDRPVIDATELAGNFDMDLAYEAGLSATETESTRVSLATALAEQLGLRLEKRDAEVELLVIDQADKVPAAN